MTAAGQSSSIDFAELRERVREALPLADVMRADGITLRRSGPMRFVCECPFHQEKTGSFVVGGRTPDRGHCFGCGWDGDTFAYWMARRSVEFRQCVIELADMAGIYVPAELRDPQWRGSVSKPLPRRSPEKIVDEHVKPALPPLRCLRPEECEQLAAVRGIDVAAVRYAAFERRRVAFSMWPLYRSSGLTEAGYRDEWMPRSQGAWASWLVTDDTRNVAEYRRLDGGKYPKAGGGEIKAWSTAGKNWPLGANQMGHVPAVLLVEGGPDMLAAYHFLLRFRMEQRVAVVCMLGASNRLRPESLPAFAGKRVRIMMDADTLKEDGAAPGLEAAWRWQDQLSAVGAAVETFSLYGLMMPDGSRVKDLNDLARCPESTWGAPEIREAFCAWDF